MQNFHEDSIGSIVTSFDNSARQGAPFSAAACLPRTLNRQDIVRVVGRPTMHGAVITTWHGSFEIRDSTVFEAMHGHNFNVLIYRPFQPQWDDALVEEEDNALFQTRLQAVPAHSPVASTTEVPVTTWTPFSEQALRILTEPDEVGPFLSIVEIVGPATAHTVQHELRAFGHHVQAFIVDHQTAAFCRTRASLHSASVLFVNLAAPSDSRYFIRSLARQEATDQISCMRALYGLGFEKAVITDHRCHQSDFIEIHFQEPGGYFAEITDAPRTQKPWPAPQPLHHHPSARLFKMLA